MKAFCIVWHVGQKCVCNFSMVNMVSAAIFGDGAAAVLMSSKEEDQGPEIIDQAMYHFYDFVKASFVLQAIGRIMVFEIVMNEFV